MSEAIALKLLAIVAIVAIGWIVGRARWLSPDGRDGDPARTLSNAAFYIFVPALLFRTTARIDLETLPWHTLAAFFIPVLGGQLLLYLWQRHATRGRLPAAAPSVRALSASFGNTVQVGVPMSAALFGEAGLAVHVTVISLHALSLLTLQTALVELDLARERQRQGGGGAPPLLATLRTTLYNTIVHPVVLPVLAGLLWNAAGWPLPGLADELLLTLGQAVVPLCLVLIGMSLAYYGLGGALRGAIHISLLKLLVLPAVVFVFAHWGMGLVGMPLGVVVMAAALPVGANALMFAQRYATLQAEATAAIVVSTLAFVLAVPLWLAVLASVA